MSTPCEAVDFFINMYFDYMWGIFGICDFIIGRGWYPECNLPEAEWN